MLRIALFAVVCCVIIPIHGQEKGAQPASDKQATGNTAPPAPAAISQNATQTEGNGAIEQPHGYFYRLFSPENLPNVGLFFAGIGGIIVAVKTLKAINGQLKEMSDAGILMKGQFEQMQKQVTEMEKQTRHLETSVIAAKTSADIAARVASPTLVIDKFEQGNVGAANLEATLQYPNVKIVIKNYGQTPAFLRSWNIIFTCEDLPPVPDYWNQPGQPGVKPPAAGILLEKDVVQPNQSYTLPDLFSWHRTEISLDDVRAIIDHKKCLWAYGFICYYDLFGSPLRRIKFCEMALNFHDGWIGWISGISPESYRGTEDYIFPQSPTGKGVEDQAISTDSMADPQPEKAN